jgi:hypothetical protein
MATVTNPSNFELFCLALRRSIAAGDTVEVTDEEAARVSRGVFVVNESTAPVRRTVSRGGRRVEVTGAPASETR